MPTQIFRSPDGLSVLVIHEPGNMTRYVGTAMKIQDGPVGYKNHWVVSFPQDGASYFFEENMHVDYGYAMEKLGMRRTGMKLSKSDVSEMTKMIAMMVPGMTASTCTDDTGHLFDAEIIADAAAEEADRKRKETTKPMKQPR